MITAEKARKLMEEAKAEKRQEFEERIKRNTPRCVKKILKLIERESKKGEKKVFIVLDDDVDRKMVVEKLIQLGFYCNYDFCKRDIWVIWG